MFIFHFIVNSKKIQTMISLQLAISNLKPTNYQQQTVSRVNVKFGMINTVIDLRDGFGGKCLYLNLTLQELQDLYNRYACGLLIEKQKGKYFSLLSLQNVKIADKVICQSITFFNDFRQVKFKCQFSINAKTYKSPKIANTQHIQMKQNGLNLLKKPPVPKQSTSYNNFINTADKNAPLTSFLYGNKAAGKYESPAQKYDKTDHLKTMKEGIRKQNETVSQLQKKKYNTPHFNKNNELKTSQIYQNDSNLFDINPPAMQFTNQQQQHKFQVPKLAYMQYQTSNDKPTQQKFYTKPNFPSNSSKFQTFNQHKNSTEREQSPQTVQQFQLIKKQNKNLPPKMKKLTKQEIKRLAKQQAEGRSANDKIMIPIAKGDKYELVPLSKLKPQQIIDYVQKQKKIEQQAYVNQLKAKRLQQKEKQIQQQKRKYALRKQRQAQTYIRKSQKQARTIVNKQIKQQENDESQNNEDEYQSDFQSMSISNSAIRSRISSKPKNNRSKEQESALEDQYSQQFQSYSQSIISKTNRKNKEDNNSISDYSQSYKSISQSYKK